MENLQSKSKVIGIRQSRKVLIEGSACTAYIARDCDSNMRSSLLELCDAHAVPIIHVATMVELGKVCGIERGAAIAVTINE